MNEINLKISIIKKHGFLCASILELIGLGIRTAPEIADILHFTTERQIETALESLKKIKVIERVGKAERIKGQSNIGATKTAFIL
jgi:hypothetical protein